MSVKPLDKSRINDTFFESKEFWYGKMYGYEKMGYQCPTTWMLRDIVFKLNLPDEGKIVQLGTGLGLRVEILCQKYGYDRCFGYDLFNPLQHSNVIIKDCNTLSENDDVPLSFILSEAGHTYFSRDLRYHCQGWIVRNMKLGGYALTLVGNTRHTKDDLIQTKIKYTKMMTENGFKAVDLFQYDTDLEVDYIGLYLMFKKVKHVE